MGSQSEITIVFHQSWKKVGALGLVVATATAMWLWLPLTGYSFLGLSSSFWLALGIVFVSFWLVLSGLVLSAKGRVVVAGDGWIEVQRRHRLAGRERAIVSDAHNTRLRTEPIEDELRRGRYTDWLALVIEDESGQELLRGYANPADMNSDYQERFSDWCKRGSW